MEFLGDQGRDVVHVWNFLSKGDLMFIGPQTSIGNMYLGPWFYYFIAPALLLFNYSPVGPSVLIAICAVITTYLIYKLSDKWFNTNAAVVSSFAFAISPVIIKYTSFSWNPNIMPLFALLFIYALVQKRYIVAALSFVMILNSHYLGLLLLAPAALILFNQKPKLTVFIKPIIVVALFFLPLVLFDIKHKGQNVNSIVKFFTVRQETVNLKPYKAIPEIFPLTKQITTRILVGKDESLGLIYTVVFLLLLFIVFLLHKKDKNYLYLLTWFISGVFGLALYKQHIYDHYFAFLFPVLCMLLGVLVYRFKYLGLILFTITIFTSIQASHLKYAPNNQLQTAKTIVNRIVEASKGQDFNLALLAKQNYDPPYRYFMYLQNAPVKEIIDQKTTQLFVICEPFQMDCEKPPLGHPEFSIAAFGPARLDNMFKIGEITIFKLVPAKI